VAVYREMVAAIEVHLGNRLNHDGARHNRALEATLRRRSRALRSRLAYWERRLPKEHKAV
jgi:hypothetical protein